MSEGPGTYCDPDECPAIRQMQEEMDELRRDMQQLKGELITIREMIEDRDQH